MDRLATVALVLAVGLRAAFRVRAIDRRLPLGPSGSAIVTWVLLVVADLALPLVGMLVVWLVAAMELLCMSTLLARAIYGVGGVLALAHAARTAWRFGKLAVHVRSGDRQRRRAAAKRRVIESAIVLACAGAFFCLPSVVPIGGRWGEMGVFIALVYPLTAAGIAMLTAALPLIPTK